MSREAGLELYYDVWRLRPPPLPPEPVYSEYVWLLVVGLCLAVPVQWLVIVLMHERAADRWTTQRWIASVLSGPLAAGLAWLLALERHIAPSAGLVALYMLGGALAGWTVIVPFLRRAKRVSR